MDDGRWEPACRAGCLLPAKTSSCSFVEGAGSKEGEITAQVRTDLIDGKVIAEQIPINSDYGQQCLSSVWTLPVHWKKTRSNFTLGEAYHINQPPTLNFISCVTGPELSILLTVIHLSSEQLTR